MRSIRRASLRSVANKRSAHPTIVHMDEICGLTPRLGELHTSRGWDVGVNPEPNDGGKVVWLDHGNGIESGYFHMEEGSLWATRGTQIAAGTQIDTMGETGCKFGCHLLFELHNNSKPIDPEPSCGTTARPSPHDFLRNHLCHRLQVRLDVEGDTPWLSRGALRPTNCW
ncbi:M23 family metallopeptidase [Microbacterium arborescens]|uniref:M23 family metallopeptidase n=1 Tax=Microbacterium arborescens TaxID=33883 RepID=UPI0035229F84